MGTTLTGIFIIDPDSIILVIGDRRFVVRGRLAKGLRALASGRD